jgi:hypothetical protein
MQLAAKPASSRDNHTHGRGGLTRQTVLRIQAVTMNGRVNAPNIR